MTAKDGDLMGDSPMGTVVMYGLGIYDEVSISHPRQHSDCLGKRDSANIVRVVGVAPRLSFDLPIGCCF